MCRWRRDTHLSITQQTAAAAAAAAATAAATMLLGRPLFCHLGCG